MGEDIEPKKKTQKKNPKHWTMTNTNKARAKRKGLKRATKLRWKLAHRMVKNPHG